MTTDDAREEDSLRSEVMRARPVAAAGAAIAVLAAAAGGASPALAATDPSCSAGSTLGVTKSARVFKTTVRNRLRVYGCSTTTKKRSYLGTAANDGGEGIDTSLIAVAGPRVAYVRQTCWDSGCSETVLVFDLKTRKDRSVAQVTPGDLNNKLTNIVLSATGVVGWIAEDRQGDPGVPTARFVVARQPGLFRGIDVVPIATSLDIVSGSLALGRNTLYWLQPTAQSTTLP